MANQSIEHPQVCQATNLNPRHLRRCSQYRPPIVPPGRPNRG